MKKIFIGNNIVFIGAHKDVGSISSALKNTNQKAEIWQYAGKKDLAQKIATIEATPVNEAIIIANDSAKELEKVFFSFYKPIAAAGGAVFNEHEQLLMMFRRGKWDLPKGKADKGETIRQTARREIREETGIEELKIIAPIKFVLGKQECTYHTYNMKGQKVIKATHWFKMTSTDKKKLTPQTLEGIEIVEWCSKKKVEEYLKNSFHSIEEVVAEAMKLE